MDREEHDPRLRSHDNAGCSQFHSLLSPQLQIPPMRECPWRAEMLVFVIPLVVLLVASPAAPRCLEDYPVVSPARFFNYEGELRNITLEVSNLGAQRLTTEIFKIFLEEVLGYPYVSTVEQEEHFNAEGAFQRLAGPVDEDRALVPSTMVNLEVWVPPNVDASSWSASGSVEEAGLIGPPGRFGWFVPKVLTSHLNGSLHWTMFKNPRIASTFNIPQVHFLEHVTPFLKNPNTNRDYCVKDFCSAGVFVPENCKTSASACAVLLADNPDDTWFVVSQIEELGLLVRVAWVGPKLKELVERLTDLYSKGLEGPRSLVVLTWRPGNVVQDLPMAQDLEGPGRPNLLSWTPMRSTPRPEEKDEVGGNWIDVGGSAAPTLPPRWREYDAVTFPPCEAYRSLVTSNCKYEMHRLVKVVWSSLKEGARTAYEAIHRVRFTSSQYRGLLESLNNHRGGGEDGEVRQLACGWLRQNTRVWKAWVPHSDKQKTALYIGGIFPISGTTYTARSVVTAANMAREAINNNDTVLRDYHLNLYAYDGQCKADVVMKSFIEYMRLDDYKHFVGILGPACSDTVEPLAGVSRHFKTIVISYSAEGSSFSDRKKYPYFFRTIGENKQYRHVYLKLFNALGWSRVAALTEDGQKYTEYISHLQDLLQNNSIHFVSNRKFPRERSNAAMSQYLLDLKNKNARIIIADVNDKAARSVMCEAYHQNMTARDGYVWFLPLWLSPSWYDTDFHNSKSNQQQHHDHGDAGPEITLCTKEQMIRAIDGHLSMTHSYFASESDVMQENITVGEWRRRYRAKCAKRNMTESNYAGYAYDAVWTYALALSALISENQAYGADLHSDETAKRFVEYINQVDFNGVSGRINFASGPSRISVINVMQWLNGSTRIIGSFYPNATRMRSGEFVDGRLELNMSAIVWLTPNGEKPEDGRRPPKVCVLEGLANLLDVSCEVAIVVANVIGFGFLAILIGAAFILMKQRYERKVQMQQKYMKSLGLDILSNSSMHSLDKWEIPRDRVVINRKLGEGAFGTVYGGEADFDERGWMAVAVKTLKVGSNTEEKLDFLSEAEVMKRFDHKNIVKLLGVCTKSEPVYTVMEFMLYGDLKTFLLARRHLVNEKNAEESDEISSKKLTNMALDVARGLSYLAELKYVHRDIASRNCLINTSRVVKIGDFGMTRPMYENDYYKFNRKGMLPVRWMAPESLGLGIFTPMSDVWSYGVFLYELITFGSFPFQGLSNNQVLEHVKAGNTLTIPNGVKPQLEALLRSCWNLEVKKRPQASEIVDFLANNPRLISPCLDVPLASVQMEDSDQLEIHLPQRIRKCSMSMTTTTGVPSTPNDMMRHRSLSGGNSSQPFFTHDSHLLEMDDCGGISLDLEPQQPTLAQLLDNGCVHEPLLGGGNGGGIRAMPSSSSSNSVPVSLSKYVTLQRTGGGGGAVGASGGKLVDPRNESMSNTSIL
ncbi:uncharacterized protein LOC124154916 [Ischnura elegans]|uniref:uncharacterized protein LOC124154916 n=1 Tax=Ischnura elegans TaxID=197161 RepID=UPI001ED86918|nr:uncharacterized protein LOC124154916 [Ischnura elegans]